MKTKKKSSETLYGICGVLVTNITDFYDIGGLPLPSIIKQDLKSFLSSLIDKKFLKNLEGDVSILRKIVMETVDLVSRPENLLANYDRYREQILGLPPDSNGGNTMEEHENILREIVETHVPKFEDSFQTFHEIVNDRDIDKAAFLKDLQTIVVSIVENSVDLHGPIDISKFEDLCKKFEKLKEDNIVYEDGIMKMKQSMFEEIILFFNEMKVGFEAASKEIEDMIHLQKF